MSILWERSIDDTHYSVRRSGSSIRLYTNRVFHSQWNPKQPFAGGIWDCLSLPVFHRPPDSIRRVLILGLGGGAVVNQLRQIGDFEFITAVEIDEVHLDIARDWFEVAPDGLCLVHADAIDWLYQYEGPAFDLIIDDLFGHRSGQPVRACTLNRQWLSQLGSHLNGEGLLVVNCVDEAELRAALPEAGDAGFRYGYRWFLPTYENNIGVFSRQSIHARQWSRQVENSKLSAQSQRQARIITRRPLRGLV